MKIKFYDKAGAPVLPELKNKDYVLLKRIPGGIQRDVGGTWVAIETIVAEDDEKVQQSLTVDIDGGGDKLQGRILTAQYRHVGDPPPKPAPPAKPEPWSPGGSASWTKHARFVTRLEFKGPELHDHQGEWDLTGDDNPPLRLKIILKRKI